MLSLVGSFRLLPRRLDCPNRCYKVKSINNFMPTVSQLVRKGRKKTPKKTKKAALRRWFNAKDRKFK